MGHDLRDLDPFDVTSSVYFDQGMRKLVDPPEPPHFMASVSGEPHANSSPWLITGVVLVFCCLVVATDAAAHWAWRTGAAATLVLSLAIAGALWLRQTFTGRGPSGHAASGVRSRRR